MDNFGNLHLIQKGQPIICAHMDTVQTDADIEKLKTIRIKK